MSIYIQEIQIPFSGKKADKDVLIREALLADCDVPLCILKALGHKFSDIEKVAEKTVYKNPKLVKRAVNNLQKAQNWKKGQEKLEQKKGNSPKDWKNTLIRRLISAEPDRAMNFFNFYLSAGGKYSFAVHNLRDFQPYFPDVYTMHLEILRRCIELEKKFFPHPKATSSKQPEDFQSLFDEFITRKPKEEWIQDAIKGDWEDSRIKIWYPELAGILSASGADVNSFDSRSNFAPIHHACEEGDLDKVKFLHQQGAKLDLETKEFTKDGVKKGRDTPLHIASFHGHVEIVDYLLKNGMKVNVKNAEGITPLHNACRSHFPKYFDCVKLLIAKQADVHATDNQDHTTMHYAAYGNALATLHHLQSLGVNPICKNHESKTPFANAFQYGQLKIFASYFSDYKCIKEFLEKEDHEKENNGNLILFLRANAKKLLDEKSAITPLEIAFLLGDCKLARALMHYMSEQQFQAMLTELSKKYPESLIKTVFSDLDWLIVLFDRINFKNKNAPDYLELKTLTQNPQKYMTDLREFLEDFIYNIRNREPVSNLPQAYQGNLAKWYQDLDNSASKLTHILINHKSVTPDIAKALLSIAEIGSTNLGEYNHKLKSTLETIEAMPASAS